MTALKRKIENDEPFKKQFILNRTQTKNHVMYVPDKCEAKEYKHSVDKYLN